MKKILYILLLLIITSSLYADQIFFTRGSSDVKEIALSFDDGPSKNTKSLLKILDKKNVKATFFLLGTSVEDKPALVKEIYSKGHELANHTYNHINFLKYKEESREDKLKEELLQCQDLIKSITGYRTKIVRFPNGYFREDALKVAKETNYKIVNWTFGMDWEKEYSGNEMLENYLNNVKPGAIFLIHDWDDKSKIVKELPKLIDEIKKKGYKFVTIGEMIEKRKKENQL
ncbi:MAG: polysaccharide deacetylase family protein [Endomicrobiaceae bacterium]|nr:polysaccharide deacetylase family protein [Endomicrobiaceae bacterium]